MRKYQGKIISVNSEEFRNKDVRNYYGMVEQTGSVFMECEYGFLHDNHLNYIISRTTKNLEIQSDKKKE